MESIKIYQIPLGDKRLKSFYYTPWQIFQSRENASMEVQQNERFPLRAEMLGSGKILHLLGTDIAGLWTLDHPYHKREGVQVMHWVAEQDGKLVGRISAALNPDLSESAEHFNGAGYFGFFESIPDKQVGHALLSTAVEWLAGKGCTKVIGPGGYSVMIHEAYQGLLVSGFGYPPSVELNYNPPYYQVLIESFGFKKLKDYVAFQLDMRAMGLSDRLDDKKFIKARKKLEDEGFEFRNVDLTNKVQFRKDLEDILAVYNSSWKHNWGYVPMTQGEVDTIADNLYQIAVSEFLSIVQYEGRPVAMFGGIPDPRQLDKPVWSLNPLKRLLNLEAARLARVELGKRMGKINHLRIMFFGIEEAFRTTGVYASMLQGLLRAGFDKGLETEDTSLLLEDNGAVWAASRRGGGGERLLTPKGPVIIPDQIWRIYVLNIP